MTTKTPRTSADTLRSRITAAIAQAGAAGINNAELVAAAGDAPRSSVNTALARLVQAGEARTQGIRDERLTFAVTDGPRTVNRAVRWTPEADAILRKWYPDHGAAKVAELTGRTHRAVTSRAINLGVPCDAVIRWANHGGPNRGRGAGRKKALENVPMPKANALAVAEPTVTLKKPRGPADTPGELIFTEKTKFTFAPPPPRVLRTNTHSQF